MKTLLAILALLLLCSCAISRPMKECREVKAEGYEDYWLCKEQFKIFR